MASNDGSGNLPRGLLGRNRTGKTARLPSIRAPRDLTLGGVQKKTFVPNIPVRPRDKSREEKAETSTPSTSQSENRGRGGRGRGRGRGRDRGDFIQTTSIFDTGAADVTKQKSGQSTDRVSTPKASSGSSSGRTSSSTIKLERRDDKNTKQILDQLLRDDFIEGAGLHGSDPALDPIQLPLYQVKDEVKTNIKVKKELDTEDVDMREESPVGTVFNTHELHPLTAAELFSQQNKSEQGTFVLFQLPDTLPGDRPSDDPHPGHSSSAPQKQRDDLSARLGLCSIADFSDGHIGRLQTLRSGRTRLVLGNTALDVNMGTPTGFLQQVISARIENNAGDMSVLGHVNHRVVCIPDFEAMLDDS